MLRIAFWSLISRACAFPDESGLLQTKQVRVAGLASPPLCADGDSRNDASGCCTEFCQDGEFRHKLCQNCIRPECPEGEEIVDVEGVCCPECTPIPCQDEVGWRDDQFGGTGTATCQDMAANPRWCIDHGDYSKHARKSCPVSCNVCRPPTETCQDKVGWRDHQFGGNGKSTCQDMVANPKWCTDYGRYSKHASMFCPESCNVCCQAGEVRATDDVCCEEVCQDNGAFLERCIGCAPCPSHLLHVDDGTCCGTCSEPDCLSREVWSEAKTDWCCANENLGCPPTCHEFNGCDACLAGGCVLSAGGCREECTPDVPCWDLEQHPGTSVEELCAQKEVNEQDQILCAAKENCGDCTGTLKSDNNACQWSEDGYCADSHGHSPAVESCEPTCHACLAGGRVLSAGGCREECTPDVPCWGLEQQPGTSVEELCAQKEVNEQDQILCAAKENCGECTGTLKSDNNACQWSEDGFCADSHGHSPAVESCAKNCDTCPQGYFDGCNTCRCPDRSNSAVGFCTRKFCLTEGQAYCLPRP